LKYQNPRARARAARSVSQALRHSRSSSLRTERLSAAKKTAIMSIEVTWTAVLQRQSKSSMDRPEYRGARIARSFSQNVSR
jgi:hypothetical protein